MSAFRKVLVNSSIITDEDKLSDSVAKIMKSKNSVEAKVNSYREKVDDYQKKKTTPKSINTAIKKGAKQTAFGCKGINRPKKVKLQQLRLKWLKIH